MCCVMPPASVEATWLLRRPSSRVVLPWSTWPMMVTTGGRGARRDGSPGGLKGQSLAHRNFIPDRVTTSLTHCSSRTESGSRASTSRDVFSRASSTWSGDSTHSDTMQFGGISSQPSEAYQDTPLTGLSRHAPQRLIKTRPSEAYQDTPLRGLSRHAPHRLIKTRPSEAYQDTPLRGSSRHAPHRLIKTRPSEAYQDTPLTGLSRHAPQRLIKTRPSEVYCSISPNND
ncbi:hypothetical protein EYF80_068118 [Liparis tanakae]|uniref:Uncharacterized protein n=1 Tax=Liparis tanakae TaxID=230148 RepID=A0A4Z2DZU3_9TELE|nr:hypothetical protein EYF80_068118 [Liparis tanakae]